MQTKRKILLVEDEPTMQYLFGFSLKKEGYEVKTADNGVKALQVLEDFLPDAIVCDIMMPEMDGFGFLKEIKSSEQYKDIPFVFLTAHDVEQNILKGLNLEADDIIGKSDGVKVLLSKLSSIFRKRNELKTRITSELDQASKSTGVILQPEKPPHLDFITMEHFHESNEGIPGGDFIDYIKISENKILVVLGDVMGKKWKAWVFAHAYIAYIRSSVRAIVEESEEAISTSEVMREVNRFVYRDDKIGEALCALTLMLISRDPKTNSVTISLSNSLQYPILHYKKQTDDVHPVQVNSSLIGFKADSKFEEQKIILRPGDAVLATTDGISEFINGEKPQHGFETIRSIFLKTVKGSALSAEKLVLNINPDYEKGVKNNFSDDASLILISVPD